MVEMARVVHNDYEKIIDDIFWFSSNWVMRFVVVLNRYSEKYGKTNFHKEVGYYKDNHYCLNINRSFDYYILIENSKRNDEGMKESIMIRLEDMPIFKFRLNDVCKWFMSDEYKGLFMKKDDKIIVKNTFEPIKLTGLPLDKYIEFEPSVFTTDNDDQIIGIRMYMSNDENSIFLSVNKVLALNEFIQSFNMYQSAQIMLNYIGRPEVGTNLYDVSKNSTEKYKTSKFFN